MIAKLIEMFLNSGRWILDTAGLLWRLLKKVSYWLLAALIPMLFLWFAIGRITDWWEFRDDEALRGAAAIADDPYDAPISREDIRYLDQGWDASDSLWFYNTSQGSDLLPYDFFIALKQADSDDYFRDAHNINRFRYLPQIATIGNPDGLPVGMSKDTYLGKEYLGFTCAACHTSQINYDGEAIRIDGGPAAADMENFIISLADSLEDTVKSKKKNTGRIQLFYNEVLSRGNYKSEDAIDDDLLYFARRIRAYTDTNEPKWEHTNDSGVTTKGITHYGYGRLDAFGRIYNRVLQYILSPDQIVEVLHEVYPEDLMTKAESDLAPYLGGSLRDEDRNDLLAKVLTALDPHLEELTLERRKVLALEFRARIFNPADAPVSIPYLWDIPHHDYVQWTGLVGNAGLGALGRNVGQVIGVFGTLDWQQKKGWTFNSVLAGQSPDPQLLESGELARTYIDFKSSIDKRNLSRVEKHLRSLTSPEWPTDLFGKIDEEKWAAGEIIFEGYCASCHTNIDRISPTRKIVAHISGLDEVSTDPVLAENTVSYRGYGGLLRGNYVEAGPGNIVIEKKAQVASLVKFATRNVVTEWDPDKNAIRRVAEWAYDSLKTARDNKIQPSLKRGTYEPATTVDPFSPLKAYKARALNGIWATAPYLHNGSVPSLYELLLPMRRSEDATVDENGVEIEYRPETFITGSREFEPSKVGFVSLGYGGFVFDTNIRGNSNSGHEYAAGRTPQPDGRVRKALTKVQRMQLLEYLKTL